MTEPIVFNGVQPPGELTIGNYMDTPRQWVNIQDDCHCIYYVADQRTVIMYRDTQKPHKATLDTLALYPVCDIDPEKDIISVQSRMPEHAQLGQTLNCYTYFDELSRVTRFKGKSACYAGSTSADLLDYSVLMVANILLCQTNLVPVGENQRQRPELSRNIAQRFDALCSEIFKVSEPFIPKSGAHVISLLEPTKKMFRSDNSHNSVISLLGDPESAVKKVKYATADSDELPVVRYGTQSKASVSDLLGILSMVASQNVPGLEKQFEGKIYGHLKDRVADTVSGMLTELRERHRRSCNDEAFPQQVMKDGAEEANAHISCMLETMYEAVGSMAKP